MSLARALRLAGDAAGRAYPKPTVGAVVVRDGEIVGEGATEAGGRHAEVVALAAAGERARGATLFATLEPCSHWGTNAAVHGAVARRRHRAGRGRLARPESRGGRRYRGAARRRGRGRARSTPGGARAERGLARRGCRRGRPFVTYKVAVTLDGRVVVPGGRWVSGEASRRLVHELRAASMPSPSGWGPCAPTRRGSTRATCRRRAGSRAASRSGAGRCRAGSELELRTGALRGRARALAAEGVQSLLLEGGPTLAGAFLEADLVDKLLVFVAPMLAGGGRVALAARLASPRPLSTSAHGWWARTSCSKPMSTSPDHPSAADDRDRRACSPSG